MSALKRVIRNSWLRPVYLWLAQHYRTLRRLFIYPETANIGAVDYDTYWEQKKREGMGKLSAWRARRAQVFTDIVQTGDRVLDLGVGDGALLHYMLQRVQIDAYGLDISPKAVEFCRENGLNVDLADINQPITNFIHEPVDYIIMSEIIEHVPDPESLLTSLRPYARKGLIVSIPNTGFYTHRLRLLFGKFPLQWVVTPGEHLRYWTRTDFHWWARQIQLRINHEYPYEGTPILKDLYPNLFAAALVYVLVEP